MSKFRLLSLALILIAPPPLAGQSVEYPETRKISHTERMNGVSIEDPYVWMEDLDDDSVHDWAREQDALFESFVSGVVGLDTLVRRIDRLRSYDVFRAPEWTPAGHFYVVDDGGGVGRSRVWLETASSNDSRLLLDAKDRLAAGRTFAAMTPSPDGKYLAWSSAEGQSRWRELRVMDVASGEDLPDRLDGLHALGGPVSWMPDGSGFFYVRYALPTGEAVGRGTPQDPRVFFHRIGTAQAADRPVFERRGVKDLTIGHTVTPDGERLILTVREGASPEVDILHAKTGGDRFDSLARGPHTFLGLHGDRFLLYTTQDAPNGRIVSVTAADPGRMTEIVPQMDEPISGNSLVGGNGIGYFGGYFVVLYTKDALPLVRVFERDGTMLHELDLPDTGTIWGGFVGRPDRSEVYYRFLSLSDATVVHRLDPVTGRSTVFKRPDLAFDPNRFVSEQVFFRSADGTRVPMFIVHRRDLALDGSNPAFIYGYGAYAWTAFLWYQPHIIAWMEMGGVYALPGIRGGGEYGRSWHQSGTGRNRQNAIDDYVAATEWLIGNGYTSADGMVANGGSASGSLAAAAVLQRPELYGAAVIDIPSFDMLHRGSWVQEFGDPENPEDFEALLAWSPYHNIDPSVCYPPILIMAGERDETALPWHAYKFTARLQERESCGEPKLLNVMWGTGHSHGVSPWDQAENWAGAWAFLARVLDP